MAVLITRQNTLEQLMDRPKVRETKWFNSFGNAKQEKHKSLLKAVKDLRQNFIVRAQEDRRRHIQRELDAAESPGSEIT